MQPKRSTRLVAALLALLMFAVAGCSGKSTTSGSGTSSGTSDSKLSGTLTYWSMWNKDEPQMKVLQATIDAFEKANPGVKVNIQWGGREILTKVRTAITSGSAPDLVDKDAEELNAALIVTGQALPLDDVVAAKIDGEDKTVADVIAKPHLDMFAKDGKPALIPYELISSGIWYDENLFTKQGIKPPTTWDEFIKVIADLKAKNVTPLVADGTEDVYNAYWYYWLAERYLGPDGFRKVAGDKTGAGWDNPGVKEAAKRLEELVKAGAFQKGYDGTKWPAGQTQWAKGDGAMLLLGSWAPSETKGYATPGFKYRMFPFPTVPGGKNSVEAYLIGWSIPKTAKNPELAKKFILFALNKDRLKGIADVADNLTSRKDLAAPAVLTDVKALFDAGTPTHRVYDGIQSDYPGWFKTVFSPINNDLFFGKITADQFVSKLKEQSVTYWKTNNK